MGKEVTDQERKRVLLFPFSLSLALHLGLAIFFIFESQQPRAIVSIGTLAEIDFAGPLQPSKQPKPETKAAPKKLASPKPVLAESVSTKEPSDLAPVSNSTSSEGETEQSATAVGGLEGSSPDEFSLEKKFLQKFHADLQRKKFYPASARARRREGQVLVKFVLKKDGSFEDVSIDSSSRSVDLDQAALTIVRKLEGRHLIPDGLGRERWVLKIPVDFTLQ